MNSSLDPERVGSTFLPLQQFHRFILFVFGVTGALESSVDSFYVGVM